ncbi:cyclin-like protein [Chytriomyces sp. MP71]|nr:cyclin-like protein [Chytriomyces sp. MP71]
MDPHHVSHNTATPPHAVARFEQWRYSVHELRHPPSVVEGAALSEDRDVRSKAAKYISNMGISLRLPQLVIATAQTFMHRFYMRQSSRRHKYHDVAAASIYLATKVEETGRRLKSVVQVAHQKAAKNDLLRLDEKSKDFQNWALTIVFYEELLLQVLCWDLAVDFPYEKILILCKQIQAPQERKDAAWALANDSYRTTICLQYSPRAVAVACVIIGGKTMYGGGSIEDTKRTPDLEEAELNYLCATGGAEPAEVLDVCCALAVLLHRDVYMRLGAAQSGMAAKPHG